MIKKVYFVLFVLLNFFSRSADNVHIPIVYACDDNYVMPTIVSMESAVNSMKDTSFYEFTILVPGEFKSENERRFATFQNSYKDKCSVNIVNMCNAYNDYCTCKWGKAMYYRLDIPFILPDKDKAIYLDGDTLVRHDLQEMCNIDLGDNLCGGIRDPQYDRVNDLKAFNNKIDKYINSGVLLINCEAWRKELSIKGDIKNYCQKVKEYNFRFPDQDVLNVICGGRIKGLSLKFMWFMLYRDELEYKNNEYAKLFCSEDEFKEAKNNPVIVHYIGGIKPWLLDKEASDELYCEWYKLFDKIKEKYEFKKLKSGCCCCSR